MLVVPQFGNHLAKCKNGFQFQKVSKVIGKMPHCHLVIPHGGECIHLLCAPGRCIHQWWQANSVEYTLVKRYVTVGWHIPFKSVPFCGVSRSTLLFWLTSLYQSAPQNGISIGLSIFAQLTHVPNTYRQTHINHITCRICSNKLHLCTAAGDGA